MKTLGELEARIMQVLWHRSEPATVRTVHGELTREREIAYTTVMTVMDRLARKGMLRRDLRGRAFAYEPAVSEARYTAQLMHKLLAASRDRRGALAHFVGRMRKTDGAELLRLAEEAARRKRGK
ncbi:MAG TPA: BlaI/MecI/CopY family transcriptional regulator [Actinomycetota bacterium]|nr:BlaI/MecI/CopY family transcriptional regulator [Actinomycetota bacterium]